MSISQTVQSGDWKGEKHVPVIHVEDQVAAGQDVEIKVSIGDEIQHPNELEHHIVWIKVFFKSEDGKFPVEIADFNFSAHGEDGLKTEPTGVTKVKLEKSGTVHVLSYCNIHGLWENSKDVKVK
ncbi:superoxide reductase [Natranaerovirga hydrolytica]|uniref:Superoxide reductase n=1 Tax=Natranaerovirga hydrolytica TaxID=680378 RepID=A0A4R1N8L3_9FIRM|nr:class II SORL domain-containing protein [Natranaerovirga hydrolytica]TCK99013.1 superoxide reductase [Natranaerovirga hydrolytica]